MTQGHRHPGQFIDLARILHVPGHTVKLACCNSAHRPSPPLSSFLIGYPASFAVQQRGVWSQLKTASPLRSRCLESEHGEGLTKQVRPTSISISLYTPRVMAQDDRFMPPSPLRAIPLWPSLSWMDLGRAIQHSALPDAQGAFAACVQGRWCCLENTGRICPLVADPGTGLAAWWPDLKNVSLGHHAIETQAVPRGGELVLGPSLGFHPHTYLLIFSLRKYGWPTCESIA